jgi:hypothetical protein
MHEVHFEWRVPAVDLVLGGRVPVKLRQVPALPAHSDMGAGFRRDVHPDGRELVEDDRRVLGVGEAHVDLPGVGELDPRQPADERDLAGENRSGSERAGSTPGVARFWSSPPRRCFPGSSRSEPGRPRRRLPSGG